MIKTRGWYDKASEIVKLKKTITKTRASQFQEVGLIRISGSRLYDVKQDLTSSCKEPRALAEG
jgi:hypothetical protein